MGNEATVGKEKRRAVCGRGSNTGISSVKRDLHPKQFSFAQWCIFYSHFKEVINCTDKSSKHPSWPTELHHFCHSALALGCLFLSVSSVWPLLYVMISSLSSILKKCCITNYSTSSTMFSQRVSQCNIYHVVSGALLCGFGPQTVFPDG